MERLTKVINACGKTVVVYTRGKYEDATTGEMRHEDIRNVMRRLSDYEDTGLTPEQIISIATELKEYKQLELSPKRLSEHIAFCRRYHELFGAIDFNRLMELKERDAAKRVLLINGGIPVCPECGAKVLKHYTFCKDCGQKLEQ